MNSCQFIGRLTRDPELRIIASTGPNVSTQKQVANFTLAVNRDYDRNKTDFFRVVVWGKHAENVVQYLKKGSQCAVMGSVQNNEYTDKEGNKRQSTDIQADRVEFLNGFGKQERPDDDFPMIDDADVPF